MYSNKQNINILTALLKASGVQEAVVCPGSRNAPIVNNLAADGSFRCYPITDERSAGFFAIGIAEQTGRPVVVCVTSGSALLNLAPAVSEAYYRNIPLVIVSADRPIQWIDQNDGQTIWQQGALVPNVRKSVNLPEPHSEEEHWYCNRLVNEALIELRRNGGGPVHINVPLSEPLYEFTESELPKERLIQFGSPFNEEIKLGLLSKELIRARKPIVVIGQLPELTARAIAPDVAEIRKHFVVLQEKLSDTDDPSARNTDEIIARVMNDEAFLPDYIVYVGGAIVSKRLKQFLRKATQAKCVSIDIHGEVHDVFMNLSWLIQTYPSPFFKILAAVSGMAVCQKYYDCWANAAEQVRKKAESFHPDYSSMLAVKRLHEVVEAQLVEPSTFFYGNSSAVRWGNMYSTAYLHVNRGVNGIDGSLSTCLGFVAAKASDAPVFCVIGDLSFLYDQNGLWQTNSKKGLKILLINNHCGGIFHQMSGPERVVSTDLYVSGAHNHGVEGICSQLKMKYFKANDAASLDKGLHDLVATGSEPALLEVFVDAEVDAEQVAKYYKTITE